MNLRIIFAIARKDIVDAIRNSYILGAILLPLGFWLLFRLMLPSDNNLQIGPVAVYDQGNSRLVEQISTLSYVRKVIRVNTMAELAETVRKEAVGGLVLPANFDEDITVGRTPELTLILNRGRGGGELTAFRGLVDRQLEILGNRTPIAQIVERTENDPAGPTRPEEFRFNEFILVMLLILGLIMTGAFVVPTLLVEEKEKQTLKTILVSPASYTDVVVGKALVGLFYTLVGSVLLLVLNDGLQGNIGLLAFSIILGSLAMVEIGLLMGAFFSTAAQINSWSGILMVVLSLPTWMTGIFVSGPVESVMRLLPTYHIAQMIQTSRGDLSDGTVWVSTLTLFGFIIVFFLAIVWSLKRVER